MPLSFVIARYFAYAFAAVATAWLASFMVLSVAINAGFVYEASWGPANAREVAEGLARDGVCGEQDVPTAYRYLILDKDGYVLMTDLEGTRLEDATEMARAALAADPGTVEIEGGGSGLTYAAFPLKGGGACALVSEYLPQWVSRDLAGVLPNPQNLMLVGAAAGSALALALVARRASRVISRKMAPLAEAAGRVGAGELDFAVGSTNVREVNDVLAAMDAADVHGVSHITGGGFYENIPRCIPDGLCAKIDKSSLRTPPIFGMLQRMGSIPEHDMFNTYNMGVGMTMIVAKDDADKALATLKENGQDAYVIGEVVSGEEKVALC